MGFIGFLLCTTGLICVFFVHPIVGLVLFALGVWMISAGRRGRRIEAQNQAMIDELKALRAERDGR